MSCAWLDGARHPDNLHAATRFGKRVQKHIPGNRTDSLSLTHLDGPRGFAPMDKIERGLHTTKFKRGFQRRLESQIQPSTDRQAQEAVKATAKEKHLELRRTFLKEAADYNGFDVTSGDYDPKKVRGLRKQARYLSDRPSDELLKRGEITIRNSNYRFYGPLPSGMKHDRRQHLLVTEGLMKPRYSSVLGVGRFDKMSDGVEDQFSKAEYQPELRSVVPSLIDTIEPGKYTPRKTGHSVNARDHIFGGTWRHENARVPFGPVPGL